MRLTQVLGGIGIAVVMAAGVPLASYAADAPAADAAPDASTVQPKMEPSAAPAPAPAADEGIPSESSTAGEDADTVVEGEEPKK